MNAVVILYITETSLEQLFFAPTLVRYTIPDDGRFGIGSYANIQRRNIVQMEQLLYGIRETVLRQVKRVGGKMQQSASSARKNSYNSLKTATSVETAETPNIQRKMSSEMFDVRPQNDVPRLNLGMAEKSRHPSKDIKNHERAYEETSRDNTPIKRPFLRTKDLGQGIKFSFIEPTEQHLDHVSEIIETVELSLRSNSELRAKHHKKRVPKYVQTQQAKLQSLFEALDQCMVMKAFQVDLLFIQIALRKSMVS